MTTPEEKDRDMCAEVSAPMEAGQPAPAALHTPGPWVVQYGHETGYPRGIYAPNDTAPGGVGCIVRHNGIGFPSSAAGRANARLIAAAPDLLAACRAFLERYDSGAGRRADTDLVAQLMRAGLAKAEGSSEGLPGARSAEAPPTPDLNN